MGDKTKQILKFMHLYRHLTLVMNNLSALADHSRMRATRRFAKTS